MGIGAITVEATIGTIKALDHTRRLERLKILVNRCVANIAAKIIEFFKYISGTEMGFLSPQQLQNHSSLLTQAKAKFAATTIGEIHGLG